MSEPTPAPTPSEFQGTTMIGTGRTRSSSSVLFTVLVITVIPVIVAAVLFGLHQPIEPAHQLGRFNMVVPRNNRMLLGSEFVAEGHVVAPEDFAYDAETRVVYTGCVDGWIKRVTVNDSARDSVVEDWVNTGGRPLGLAFDHDGGLIVGDAYKGLLRVTMEKKIELLTDEFEGLKFKLTDGVDVANDGTIYFTDASYKYSYHHSIIDIFEGKPNGRFMSYDPTTKKTTLLAQNLYFPNGVAVSPDQQFVIFCETSLMNCKKYYIQGPNKGSIEKFCDLPGMPDNIHYDGQGQYWIGLATEFTPQLNLAYRYPFIGKATLILEKYLKSLHFTKNGGVVAVDLEGKPTAHYYDPKLTLTSGFKIGNHIYCGSIIYPYVIRLDIKQYPAIHST